MLLKLDENIGARGRARFLGAGHDVSTIREQLLAGAPDRRVFDVVRAESRCLVTLDLDFANPFLFPPDQTAGIAVLRLPRRTTPDDLHAAVDTLIKALDQHSITGKLWIIEKGRIRVYTPEDSPDRP